MSNAVAKASENAVATITPMDMLRQALDKGIDSEQLGKLLDLQQRWEADQARKAYVQAMTAFKSEPLSVEKRKHVKFGNTEYHHATLAQVVEAVVGKLSEHGLSHRWETSQGEGGFISVSCVITHELGHSERTTLGAGADQSGGKNSIQAVGSTVTYLQRYTLMAATGLAAHDMDDDGKGAEPALEVISKAQVTILDKLIKDTASNLDKFLEYFKVKALADLPADRFDEAKQALASKPKAEK